MNDQQTTTMLQAILARQAARASADDRAARTKTQAAHAKLYEPRRKENERTQKAGDALAAHRRANRGFTRALPDGPTVHTKTLYQTVKTLCKGVTAKKVTRSIQAAHPEGRRYFQSSSTVTVYDWNAPAHYLSVVFANGALYLHNDANGGDTLPVTDPPAGVVATVIPIIPLRDYLATLYKDADQVVLEVTADGLTVHDAAGHARFKVASGRFAYATGPGGDCVPLGDTLAGQQEAVASFTDTLQTLAAAPLALLPGQREANRVTIQHAGGSNRFVCFVEWNDGHVSPCSNTMTLAEARRFAADKGLTYRISGATYADTQHTGEPIALAGTAMPSPDYADYAAQCRADWRALSDAAKTLVRDAQARHGARIERTHGGRTATYAKSLKALKTLGWADYDVSHVYRTFHYERATLTPAGWAAYHTALAPEPSTPDPEPMSEETPTAPAAVILMDGKLVLTARKQAAVRRHADALRAFATTGTLASENGACLVRYETCTVIDLGEKRTKYSQRKAQALVAWLDA